MDKFAGILKAASKKVKAVYFKLQQYEADDVYRERVYCYELYHQMRCIWDYDDYILNGEVDKAGHPALKNTAVSNSKPDFLVHFPGDMQRNSIVVEVKSVNATSGTIKTDLANLVEFVNAVGYHRAIFIVYGEGYTNEHWVERVKAAANSVEGHAMIELWRHSKCGEEAEFLTEISVGKPT